MPIRFRCSVCHQLLGIGRRKAGTVVRCPKCTNQVMVPEADEEATTTAAKPGEQVFERSDFDEIFAPALKEKSSSRRRKKGKRARTAVAQERVSKAAPFEGSRPVQPVDEPARAIDEPLPSPPVAAPSARRQGFWLTPTLATWLSLAMLVALALAFGAGLLSGRYLDGK
jgi:phage FluMu protein Com